ncbi:hypothetical protein ACFSHR_04895 [Azotobacter chroococcum]
MRLAISNIAWDRDEDPAIAGLLQERGVDAIDVAPGKYFPEPGQASAQDIAHVRRWWSEHGIEITGMQALLFGTRGLNLFGPAQVREAMLKHLAAVCRIGALREPGGWCSARRRTATAAAWTTERRWSRQSPSSGSWATLPKPRA